MGHLSMGETMRLRKKTIVAVVGIVGLLAAGASAFTATNTFTNSNTNVGYGVETVSGAVVTGINYTLSSDGSTITAVTLTTQGDTSGSSASVGFTVDGVAGQTTACAAGTYSSANTDTTYDCTGLDQAISDGGADGGVNGIDVVVD